MKYCLLTGNLIVPQLLVTSNDKTRAVDVLKYITNKKAFGWNWKQNIHLQLGYNTEYTSLEEMSFEEFRTILSAILVKQLYKERKRKRK